jgi:hypothetical protein
MSFALRILFMKYTLLVFISKKINNFLWSFKSNSPFGWLKKKCNHYIEFGDVVNKEDKLNNLMC